MAKLKTNVKWNIVCLRDPRPNIDLHRKEFKASNFTR